MDVKEKDILNVLFSRMPDEALPSSFRENLMEKILLKAVKIKKRNERIGLFSVIFASLAMLALAGFSIWYLDFPAMTFRFPAPEVSSFYVYIGVLVLVLLFADYKFRQKYKRKHQL